MAQICKEHAEMENNLFSSLPSPSIKSIHYLLSMEVEYSAY